MQLKCILNAKNLRILITVNYIFDKTIIRFQIIIEIKKVDGWFIVFKWFCGIFSCVIKFWHFKAYQTD